MVNLLVTAHIPSLNAAVAGPKASSALHQNFIEGDIDLIIICSKGELEERGSELDSSLYRSVQYIEISYWRKMLSLLFIVSLPFKMRARCNKYVIRKLREKVFCLDPDRIFLEFTSVYGLMDELKGIGSNKEIIAIAHDYSVSSMRSRYNVNRGLLRFFYSIELKMLTANENRVLSKVDEIYVLSATDGISMEVAGIDRNKIRVLELTASMWLKKIPRQNITDNTLFFLGSMNRIENEHAVIWFIQNILPSLVKVIPTLVFYVIGRKPSTRLRSYESRHVRITGHVDNIVNEIIDKKVSVCPLHQGAGVKIKVLETLELGIPTVCSPIGAQGIPSNTNLYVCKTEKEYVETIINLLR